MRLRTLTVIATAALAVAGCGGSSSGGGGSSGSISGTVNVFAASSLTEAFTTLGKQFEAAHPDTHVVFNFGPSSGLSEQITQGAPADVFASASTSSMDDVVAAKDAADPTTFAKNVMEIATPPSNPGHVSSVTDLANKSVKVAVCESDVPCGVAAAQVFANAKLKVKPVTEELDVKSVLSKVELGEVDAGVVYVTDVRAAGDKVKGVAIASNVNATATYPIAALSTSRNSATAQAFVDYVLSSTGASVLAADGFLKP
jgi:molybdate transport system substrate-binding protein